MQNGFIIIPRAIEKYEVLQDMDALGFYTMLMFNLRFRETNVDGVEVGVNQLLISKPELAKRCNLTVAKVRRMLREFQEVGGIRCENIRNKYTRITFLDDFIYASKGDTGGKSNPPAAAVQTDECEDIIENASGNSEDEKPVIPTKNKRGELKAYGKFSNIFLSDDEYSALLRDFKIAKDAIEKLSSYLGCHPKKSTENHYAQLLLWIANEKDKQTADDSLRSNGRYGNTAYTPDSNASYDLARAEARAKASVPKFKRRER